MEQDNTAGLIVLMTFILIFLAPMFYAWLSKRRLEKVKKELTDSNDKLQSAEVERDNLNKKYKSIIDAELHSQKILDEATEKAGFTLLDAEKQFAAANKEALDLTNEAKNINATASQKLKNANETASTLTETARTEAAKIIESANVRAQEIAGEAFEAKKKADSYEAAIRAMRNTIEGYKDDYIIPNHSVLDDLAEEYSFKDAGEKLKQARKNVREMVKTGHAGSCDYVEENRKIFAIHFAVDAFNGKIDSALAKVKHDNFGKIKQEIIDAFALVNFNGAPFRNARINQEYLDARQEELKWAVSTHELRQQELAEQREIKQQIREEEKARREIEKAIKEAAKEETLLQKALEKARTELANANEEQRLEFEAQLAELEGRLVDAEERGQRALSMAQQTKRGHVYVISNVGSFGENVFKIGMTRRLEPLDRVKELGDASVPFSFDIHAMLYSEDAPALEKILHRKFELDAVNKVNSRKEFFRVSLAEIKQMVGQQDLKEVHWTMKAEAAEYKESLAISKMQQEVTAA